MRFMSCTFNRPLDRGISSIGTGCQGMFVDMCQFLSNEQAAAGGGPHLDCAERAGQRRQAAQQPVVRFAHFAVVNGTGHLIHANHFFQGDDAGSGLRRAGLIFTQTNVSTVVTGNYIDNCFIEWGNEHDAAPE